MTTSLPGPVDRSELDASIGLALRRQRYSLRLSQRAYAVNRGISPSQVARLETRATAMPQGLVFSLVADTQYVLMAQDPHEGATPLLSGADSAVAIQSARRAAGLSVRRLALMSGVGQTSARRLEHGDGSLALSHVVAVARIVNVQLLLCTGDGVAVTREHWTDAEREARVRGGGRRLPGHRTVKPTTAPLWWRHTMESCDARARPPQWTAEWNCCDDLPEYCRHEVPNRRGPDDAA